LLTNLQYRILKKLSPGDPGVCSGEYFKDKSKLQVLLGGMLEVKGKTVIDFGCGEGGETVEMALNGARRVIGLDIREDILRVARDRAESLGLAAVCHFTAKTDELADVIVSIDAFEHFANPAEVLDIMFSLLRPGGECLVSFGPTWYHALGGHLFSVFPWAHLLFSEKALIRWRSTFKSDGATRFSEVAGGLNRMTIGRFEKLVAASKFTLAELEAVPVRKLRPVHNRLTREFTTALVRCRLVRPT
jgi:SAM-dependent methyltransferase